MLLSDLKLPKLVVPELLQNQVQLHLRGIEQPLSTIAGEHSLLAQHQGVRNPTRSGNRHKFRYWEIQIPDVWTDLLQRLRDP